MLEYAIFASVLIVSLVFFVFYLYPGRPKRPSNIPGLDPADLKTGNLSDIADANGLHPFLCELHEDHGPIASFWFGDKFVVSTAHPDAFRPQMNLFDRPAELFELFKPLIGEQSIQYANGADGRALRHRLDTSFSHEAVENYIETLTEVAEDVGSKLEKMVGDQHVSLRQYMMALAFRGMLLTLFGDYFLSDDASLEFVKNYDLCWHELEQRLFDDTLASDKMRVIQFEKAKAGLQKQIRDVIAWRKKEVKAGRVKNEIFIDRLIDMSASEEQEFSIAITYAIGGFHTTGNLMAWMMYFVITHSECEEKLRDELQSVLGSRRITADDMKALTYCRQVIDETMRVSALAPYAARCANVDLKIGGYVIPKDTPIIQALGVACTDPNMWPNPMEFDPERFDPEKVKQIDTLSYPFFGFAGKRKCPGFRLAYAEATVFLSVLIRKFRMTLVDTSEIVPSGYGLVTYPDDDIWITLEKLEK